MDKRERPERGSAVFGRRSVAKVFATGAVAAVTTLAMAVGPASASTHHVKHHSTARLELCNTGNGGGHVRFRVTKHARLVSVRMGHCHTIRTSAGRHRITEVKDSKGAQQLHAISIAPRKALLKSNAAKGWANVRLAAGTSSTASFTNTPAVAALTVCTVAGNSAVNNVPFTYTAQAGGQTFGPFSVNAGSPANCGTAGTFQVGTNVLITQTPVPNTNVTNITATGGTLSNASYTAGTVMATIATSGTTVTYTNAAAIPASPGAIEVCKIAGDPYVSGSFMFTITNSSGFSYSQSVPTGQCTGDVKVPAGSVTVTESTASPYYVGKIGAIPSSALVSSNLGNASGTFTVAAGATTTALFTNDTSTGYVKACKTLGPNGAPLVGTNFEFAVKSVAGTQNLWVTAPPVGQTLCALDMTPIPVGSAASITEVAQPNVAVTGVAVSPASQDTGSSGSTANLTVGANVTSATFTNDPLSWIEVCKKAADPATAAQSFQFSVNGGTPFMVHAGNCSAAMQVPAGTATVQESPSANFSLVKVSTVSATDPTGARLLSGPTANPATVAAPYGGVATETVVTFTDAVNVGQFKICTSQTSSAANLQGLTFGYWYYYTVFGKTFHGSVSLVEPSTGQTCSGLLGPVPVVDQSGNPVTVTVQALALSSKPTSVILAASSYQGAGIATLPTTPTGLPAQMSFTVGAGMNISSFVNGRTTPCSSSCPS